MTRKLFLTSLLKMAPALAVLKINTVFAADKNKTITLVRKFYATNGQAFDHALFNQAIEALFNLKNIEKTHQDMLDKEFISKFKRENHTDHVVFKITFESEKNLEQYKNKISKLIIDRAALISHFKNKDSIIYS